MLVNGLGFDGAVIFADVSGYKDDDDDATIDTTAGHVTAFSRNGVVASGGTGRKERSSHQDR